MTNPSLREIEKAYPEAYALARRFHELYEEAAPKFGYETRKETKEFDPASPNGRLMAYVCKNLVDEVIAERDEALRKDIQEISNNTYEDTNPFYVLGKVASLLSKE